MSAKDNFAQAFKELISGAAPAEDAAPVLAANDTLEASAIEPILTTEPEAEPIIQQIDEPLPIEVAAEDMPVIEQQPMEQEPVAAKPVTEKRGFSPFSGFGGFGSQSSSSQSTPPTPPPASPPSSNPFSNFSSPVVGTTTIASGTIVIGEIHSKGDINLLGEVKGNVETLGNVQLGGRVMGNVSGNDMVLASSIVKGNVAADGTITLDDESVVMGDMKAKDGEFDGKIKGNLQVEGLARFMGNTVLLGNVNVGSLIIEQGARMRGEICTGNRDTIDIPDPFQG